MQTLIDTISSEYHHNFCTVNEKRAETFFNQLRADCFKLYSGKMRTVFVDEESVFKETDLIEKHNTTKNEALAMVCSTIDSLSSNSFLKS